MRQLIIRADDLGYSEAVNYKKLCEKSTHLGAGWIAQNKKMYVDIGSINIS